MGRGVFRWMLPAAPVAGLLALALAQPGGAQRTDMVVAEAAEPRDLRQALRSAQRASAQASARSRRLQREAEQAGIAENKAHSATTRLAARLQEAEAAANLAEARLVLVAQQRRRIERNLAAKREPLVQLTAALQRLTAQPLAFSALQPDSLRDAVYLRAVLDHAVPAVRARTASLRAELRQAQELAREARLGAAALRRTEAAIQERREALLAEAARSRQRGAQAASAARREEERAQSMALEARDLGDLVGRFDQVATLRAQLAALPGPVMRPPAGGVASVPTATSAKQPMISASTLGEYRLPVIGRITGGFGDTDPSGLPHTGVTLAPRPHALVIAPAAGRVAFAGPYRGFGQVIILEHAGGWTSLLTGLGGLQAQVGQQVAAGNPLGTAPATRPAITLELRRSGELVDPLPLALRGAR